MADSTLSSLSAASALTGTELFYSDDGSADVKVTATQLKTFAVGAGSVSVASGKTLTVSNTLTLTGTDSSSVAFGGGGTVLYSGGALGTPSSGTLTNCTGLPAAGVVGTAAILGANTFTALQTITQASANAGIIASTGYSLTGSNATSMIDLAGAVNTSGNPAIVKIAITHTALGASAKYLEILGGGSGTTSLLSLTANAIGEGVLAVRTFSATATYATSGNWFNSNSSVTGIASLGIGGDVGASSPNARLTGPAAARLQFGLADAASPVAQTIGFQSVVAGTSNTAGATAIIRGSIGTGTGAGGKISIQTAPAGGSGSSQNSLVEAFQATINGTFGITDGITAPAAIAGVAQIFVDTADGDLKVTFGDGTTKLIVADT